jgi:oligopeptide transport system permease protein
MTTTEHYVAQFTDGDIVVDAIDTSAPVTSAWGEIWKSLRTNVSFYISTVIILFVAAMYFFPKLFTSIDPNASGITSGKTNLTPSLTNGHLFGTNIQGQDIWARLVYGTHSSLTISVIVVLITTVFAIIIGAIAGYCGGIIDAIVSRFIEVFLSIPGLVGQVVILQMLRDVQSEWKLIIVLSIFGWTSTARIMRGQVMSVKSKEFITSSKALGERSFGILFKHVIPNSIAPVIATAAMGIGAIIVVESSLSFLGLGLPSNIPSWGSDISVAVSATTKIASNPSLFLVPSIALIVTTLAFIFLGDAIQNATDPKRQK